MTFAGIISKGRLAIWLRDFRCADGDKLLPQFPENRIFHIRSQASEIVSLWCILFCQTSGRDRRHQPDDGRQYSEGTRGGDTYAYSLEEIQAMLARTHEPARTVVAVAAFSGLRHSGARFALARFHWR